MKKTDEFLEHYGILGMKWGVRRDRRRAAKRARAEEPDSEDGRAKKILSKKKISSLSNAELQMLTKRIQLEKDYKTIQASTTRAGRSWVKNMLITSAKTQAQLYVNQFLADGVKRIVMP